MTVSAALLAVLFHWMDANTFWQAALNADLNWLAAGCAVAWAVLLMQTWCWQWLLRAVESPFTYWALFGHYMVGSFFGQFLPKSIGGDVVRAFSITQSGASKTQSLTVILLGRFIGIANLLIVMIICVFLSPEQTRLFSDSPFILLVWPALILAVMIFFLFVLMMDAVKKWVAHFKLAPQASAAINTLRTCKEKPLYLTVSFLISMLLQVTVLIRYYCIAMAIGVGVDFTTLAIVSILVMALASLPITLNGLGIREGGFIYLFGVLGVSAERAFAFSIVNYLLTLLMAAAGGLFYILRTNGSQIKRGKSSPDT